MTDTVARVLRGRQSPRVEFREGDAQIDITVEIAADRLDQELFDVLVTSPHLPEFDNAAPERWKLPTKAASLVTEYMADITDTALEPGQLRARILGVGKRLYAVAPPRFHEVYWRLTDRGRPPRTILVQSEEWAIPWELMVPSRLGRAGERVMQPPLGFQLALGRWLANDGHAPLQLVDLDDSYVFAPKYPRRKRLRHAQEEVELVCDAFSGTAVEPGRQRALDHALAERSVSLLHFTCHGEVRTPPIQAILLENDGRMISYELSGMDGLAQAVQDKPHGLPQRVRSRPPHAVSHRSWRLRQGVHRPWGTLRHRPPVERYRRCGVRRRAAVLHQDQT